LTSCLKRRVACRCAVGCRVSYSGQQPRTVAAVLNAAAATCGCGPPARQHTQHINLLAAAARLPKVAKGVCLEPLAQQLCRGDQRYLQCVPAGCLPSCYMQGQTHHLAKGSCTHHQHQCKGLPPLHTHRSITTHNAAHPLVPLCNMRRAIQTHSELLVLGVLQLCTAARQQTTKQRGTSSTMPLCERWWLGPHQSRGLATGLMQEHAPNTT
jgi:hypothetical protein